MKAGTLSQDLFPTCTAPRPCAENHSAHATLTEWSEQHDITVNSGRKRKSLDHTQGWCRRLHRVFIATQKVIAGEFRRMLPNSRLGVTCQSVLVATLIATAACASGAHATIVVGQGTGEATLQARDMNHDGVTDAFYDTVLKVTWLRDATVNGATSWDVANRWASTLVVAGLSGWRLPTMVDTGAPYCDYSFSGVTDCGFNVQTISGDGKTVYSEMAHLWYDTLGNKSFCALGDRSCSLGWISPEQA